MARSIDNLSNDKFFDQKYYNEYECLVRQCINTVMETKWVEVHANPDEYYFVAKIEEGSQKLDEAGVYSAVPFRTNDWIVFVCWYNFFPSKLISNGNRFYFPRIFPMDSLQLDH